MEQEFRYHASESSAAGGHAARVASMDKHSAVNTHDAIPVREPDEPYAGAAGQTRYECVHLVVPDGSLRSVTVCRAINAQTHPELKARALTGYLHRLEDGRELALPYVYHDPAERKFALVLPVALAHLELKEWSKLLSEIADDTRSAVPAYVREMTTIIGTAAFAEFVETVPERDPEGDSAASEEDPDAETAVARGGMHAREVELQERDTVLAHRERDLLEQERALIRRAEALTTRESEVQRQKEQLESHQAELNAREAEPEARRAGNWQEVGLGGDGELPHRVANDGAFEAAVGYGGSLPPPLPHGTRRSRPPPLPLRQRRTPPPLAPRRDSGFMPGRIRSTPPPLPLHDALVTEPNDPEPEVAPPEQFSSARPGQMSVRLTEDELWLFVRLDEAHASAFRHGADLALQYVEVESYPVLVLSILDQRHEHYAARCALDGRAARDLKVLEHLSRSFRARVALYVESLYIETVTVSTLREAVAQAIRDKLAKLPSEPPHLSAVDAIARTMQSPPPLWNDDLPFGPVRREAPTTVTVLAAVEQLAAWLRPEKQTEATLTYSVARHVMDATIRRVVRSAIAFGVALPDELLQQAVHHGAASDETAAVREQLQSFRQRIENKQNDLGVEATRKNWDRLIAAAEARQLEVDESTLALARSEPPHMNGAPVAHRVFEHLTTAELKQKLDDKVQRIDAIRELCTRGHASAIEIVLPVLEILRANEVAIAIAQLLAFRDAAGDGLLAALDSPNEAVRQCAALALGKLQYRSAITPMLARLEVEELAMHTEVARAFGDFGAPALRSVVRVIPSATRPDRLVLALAHLANHGCAREVEKLENDPEASVAQAARKAMARRARMEWEDLSVREQRTLTDASPAARLSQAFYAEASKVAI